MTELHFNINPAESLGDLKLGCNLNKTLDLLIKSKIQTQLRFSNEDVQGIPYVVRLTKYDIELVFDPRTQQMVMIDVGIPKLTSIKASNVRLIYENEFIKDWSFSKLYNDVFGPTQRGVSYDDCNVYILNYPGMSLKFEISSLDIGATTDILSHLLTSFDEVRLNRLYLHQYPTFDSLVESQISGSDNDKLRITQTRSQLDPLYPEIENVTILKKNHTIKIEFTHHSKPPLYIKVNQSSPEEIMKSLGIPDEIFFKQPSKLNIHRKIYLNSENTSEDGSTDGGYATKIDQDFLYHNYFRYGIDFLYDHSSSNLNKTGTLVKVIFHNNLPSSKCTFRKYQKSQYEIPYLNIDSSCYFHQVKKAFKELSNSQISQKRYEEEFNDPIIIMKDVAALMVDCFDDFCNLEQEKPQTTQQKALYYVMKSIGMVWEVIEEDQIESLTLF